MENTWQKPRLVVLVRGRPEESVLSFCKDAIDITPNGPAVEQTDCIQNMENCEACSEPGVS